MTEFLVSIPVIDMKAANLSGMTATDILMQRRITDARDLDIEQSLKPNIAPTPFHLNTHNLHHHFSGKKIPNKKKKKTKNEEGDWVDRKRSALMVAASLIATMAFQFAVTAPQNMWVKTDNSQTSNDVKDAMYYVRKTADYLKGEKFYAINTTSFIASLSIILLLMSGLPLNNRVVVWTLMMITWIAISAIALSYTVAVVSQTTSTASNEKSVDSVYTLVAITVFVWICLVTLLLLGHTVRLFVKMVKILVSPLSVRRRQYPASAATRV